MKIQHGQQSQHQQEVDLPPMKLPSTFPGDALESSRSNTSTAKLSRKEIYENKMKEAPSMAHQSKTATKTESTSSLQSIATRPVTAPNFGPSEADLKRKKYLEEAKIRNASSQKQFEDRVKGYFSKAVEIEARKAMSPGGNVKVGSKKEQQQEALEKGLFMNELKSIGLDVGKMATAASKMKPADDSSRNRRGFGDESSAVASFTRPSTTTMASTSNSMFDFGEPSGARSSQGNFGHSSSFASSSAAAAAASSSVDLSGIEARLSKVEESVAAHGNKLDVILDLQRKMLRLLEEKEGGGPRGIGSLAEDFNSGAGAVEPAAETRGRRRR